MNNMSRRSVIRGSLGLAAAGALARPYIANAAGTTAIVWAGAGLRPGGGRRVPQDGRGLREGQRQQDRPQHHAVQALNQKAISALTSGEVPDLIFHDAPADDPAAERLGRQAGGRERRRRGVQVQAQRDRAADLQLLQRRHEAAQLLPGSGQAGVRAVPYLGRPGRQGRLQAVGRAEDLGCVLGLLQAGAEGTARQGHAQDVRHGPADHHRRTERRQRPVRSFHDRQRRPGHRHQGRQAAHRRSEGARGGDQVGRIHDELLQGRLRAAGGAELERRRRQQRLPRKAVRDGSRRHAVDRTRDDQEQEGLLRGDGGDGPAEPQ